MSSIKEVPITSIRPNHLRNLATYPWIEPKVVALMRSIESVGLWESVIARPVPGGYEIAFGHHRIEAAKRLNLTSVSIIVKDLSDLDMLQYMGRENGEDYAADFLVMLNTWEAAVDYLKNQQVMGNQVFMQSTNYLNNQQVIEKAGHSLLFTQPIEIARLLGWTQKFLTKGTDGMSDTALACTNALILITEHGMSREDFKGMSVRSARDITQRAITRIKQIKDLGHMSARPNTEIERAVKTVVKGAEITTRQVREGELKSTEVRGAVEVNAYKVAQESKIKHSPLFAVFGVTLANQINKYLQYDMVSEKLDEVVKQIPDIVTEEDNKTVRRIVFELSELGNRVITYQKKLIPNNKKIVSISSKNIIGDK